MKKIIVLVITLLTSSFAFAQVHPKFTFLGQPIRPTCVALFNSTVENYPYVKAINLRSCQSGRSFPQTTHHNNDSLYFFYKNNRDMDAGAYFYKVLGETANGVYVLHTYNNDGGKGVFDMLLLMRITKEKERVYDNGSSATVQPATFLTLQSYVVGGDRCTGGIKSAKVRGNEVIVWQYPKKNSVDQCQGAKKFVIDLSTL